MIKGNISKICILFCFVLLLSSCGRTVEKRAEGISVVTTVFPQYDIVREVTRGTDTSLTMLIAPGAEPHSYDPSPADMIAAAECDLFIAIGGESEAWTYKIISSAEVSEDKMITLMDTVPLLENESGHGDSEHSHAHIHEDSDHDHVHDEHIWTSPKNVILMTETVTDRLCSIDPENEDVYRKNAETYIGRLKALDAELACLANSAVEQKKVLVFGDRFPFLYFAREYGFKYTSPFRGCSAHTEASLSEIAMAVEKAREHNAGVIFSVDFSNEKLASVIAEEAGASVARLYSCHTLSADDFEKGLGYIDLMTKNLESIRKAVEN